MKAVHIYFSAKGQWSVILYCWFHKQSFRNVHCVFRYSDILPDIPDFGVNFTWIQGPIDDPAM